MSQEDRNDSGQIVIERWLNNFLVPHDYPSPEELRWRFDRLVNARLTDVCSHILGAFADPPDHSIWLIRRLDVNLTVDVGVASDDHIARVWAEQLASEIKRILARREQSDSNIWFPNRAAYVTHFASDLAAGQAWGKWYYDEFESLRSLATGQAIGEAILRDARQAAAIILRISSLQRLEDILNTLTETDARKIYIACFEDVAASTSEKREELWTGRLLELWNEAPLRPPSHDENRFRDALRLFARAGTRFPGAEKDPSMRTALNGLLELRRVLSAFRSPAAFNQLIRDLAKNDLRHATELARNAGASNPSEALGFFAEVMDGDGDWAAQAAAVLLSENIQTSFGRVSVTFGTESILSSFGGIFLLGPSLVELDLDGIAASAVQRNEKAETAASIHRHAITVMCLGRQRASATIEDPALRLLSGFKGTHFLSALQELELENSDLEQSRSVFAKNLASNWRYDGRCLLAEAVPLPGSEREALLIRDLLRDEWIYAAETPADITGTRDALEKGVAFVSNATGIKPETLLLRGRVSALADSSSLARLASRTVSINSAGEFSWDEFAQQFGATRNGLARASRPADQDLAFFSLANVWPEVEIGAAFDLTWLLVARAALKHFARRLIGFESSGPEYLYQNFLAGLSTVRITVERIEVQIPKSPLSIILRMSGMQERRYTLPWVKGREICLLPPAE